ncbi:MAG TPA: hypothetical protein PKA37_11615, partial [Planctomycetota bacterium]|nr:hypothetical protein [Planctomycetota bacterium]
MQVSVRLSPVSHILDIISYIAALILRCSAEYGKSKIVENLMKTNWGFGIFGNSDQQPLSRSRRSENRGSPMLLVGILVGRTIIAQKMCRKITPVLGSRGGRGGILLKAADNCGAAGVAGRSGAGRFPLGAWQKKPAPADLWSGLLEVTKLAGVQETGRSAPHRRQWDAPSLA